jgi:hypothetical protein
MCSVSSAPFDGILCLSFTSTLSLKQIASINRSLSETPSEGSCANTSNTRPPKAHVELQVYQKDAGFTLASVFKYSEMTNLGLMMVGRRFPHSVRVQGKS